MLLVRRDGDLGSFITAAAAATGLLFFLKIAQLLLVIFSLLSPTDFIFLFETAGAAGADAVVAALSC